MRCLFVTGTATIILFASCGSAPPSSVRSLTDSDYTGKKYYFGWGEKLSGEMGNETRYDVLHTHDIFTKNVGGDYIGRKMIDQTIAGSDIRRNWSEVKSLMNPGDMYVQYSSGHGSSTGLGVGVSYDEIRDNVLSMPVKEAVIFTMSCYSGNLVDSFNAKKNVWKNWQAEGKTLFVMASSKASESSSTGPGTDPDQPGGPDGSAGSAYGHSLWKALIGYADGAVDGVKDGVMTLDEIVKYTTKSTQDEGNHTPVTTGVYDPKLKIAKRPTYEEAARILSGTDEGQMELDTLVADGIIR